MSVRARPFSVSTPLGPDAFALMEFTGTEGLSQLFQFELELLASNDQAVPFEDLVGRPLVVTLSAAGRQPRFFGGICSRFSQGVRGPSSTSYRAEMVPSLWFLTRRSQSRIFQSLSVPDVLGQVLGDLDVLYRLQGSYEPRNYCVQYRESDFDFASRLMEEEGIFYFFEHSEDGHSLVLGDDPQSHPDLPTVHFDRTPPERAPAVYEWEKSQSLTAGKVTLRDHSFELPNQSLEVAATIQEAAVAGQVTHHLRLAGNDRLELYDYPGEYAQRFDGVGPGGGDRPEQLAEILPDGRRTARIRMEEEAAHAIVIDGASTASSFAGGHRFALDGHFDADGQYVLTTVEHSASLAHPQDQRLSYSNRFTCIPASIPFRPRRATRKPVVGGAQTAVVVGPAGTEVFTDRYGRVKVQFFWDRQGTPDENSSCWIRVSQVPSAGSLAIPRVGWEVIVEFLEGDPDQPIILGRVYNAEQPPPRQQSPQG